MDIMTNATPVHGRVYNLTLLEDIAMQEWVKSKPAKGFIVPSASSTLGSSLFFYKKEGLHSVLVYGLGV
jgi:hypothetical protein